LPLSTGASISFLSGIASAALPCGAVSIYATAMPSAPIGRRPPCQSVMPTKSEIVDFLARAFPQNKCVVEAADHNTATITHRVGTDELRPGGTVSGPVLMTVADVALYVAVLATIGIVPLTVTTSLTINFLRKPSPDRDIVGQCRLLKVGRTLAVGEVALYSQGEEAMVAHAVGTYSIPPIRDPDSRA
jgi:acyl-coenzyme A thioesterase PaaI-like protein